MPFGSVGSRRRSSHQARDSHNRAMHVYSQGFGEVLILLFDGMQVLVAQALACVLCCVMKIKTTQAKACATKGDPALRIDSMQNIDMPEPNSLA